MGCGVGGGLLLDARQGCVGGQGRWRCREQSGIQRVEYERVGQLEDDIHDGGGVGVCRYRTCAIRSSDRRQTRQTSKPSKHVNSTQLDATAKEGLSTAADAIHSLAATRAPFEATLAGRRQISYASHRAGWCVRGANHG